MADRCLLYYITDRSQFPGDEPERRRALLAKIAEAARVGVDYIQLREKDLSGREMESLACEAVATVRENSRTTRFLVNSRTDVALAAGADGVQLRSNDVSVEDVRSVWRAARCRTQASTVGSPLIAVSCHTAAEVASAEAALADFAVFAPVFEKSGGTPAGLEALRAACRGRLPVLALGGVTLKNAGACMDAGAAGIAGIRLFQENDFVDIVQSLRYG